MRKNTTPKQGNKRANCPGAPYQGKKLSIFDYNYNTTVRKKLTYGEDKQSFSCRNAAGSARSKYNRDDDNDNSPGTCTVGMG